MPALPLPFIFQHSHATASTLADYIATLNIQLAPEIAITLHETPAGHYVMVQLTRGQKRNAISFVMMDKLIILARHITRLKTLRGVILTGEGSSFSTGIDLADLNNPKNLPKVGWELIKPSQSKFQKVCLVWRELPIPVIAVLQGHCIGAGLQLALACDSRIADSACQFSVMEAKWGLVADMGLTQSGFGQIKPDILKELAMTARVFDSEQALDYGLITHVADDPMLAAQTLMAELMERSPDSILAAKRLINAMYHTPPSVLYLEKLWQIKLIIGSNRKIAVAKAAKAGIAKPAAEQSSADKAVNPTKAVHRFIKRQFG